MAINNSCLLTRGIEDLDSFTALSSVTKTLLIYFTLNFHPNFEIQLRKNVG